MPEYEFKCHHCGFRYVGRYLMSEICSVKVWCEQCGTQMTRIFDVAGIIFKGSGWASKDG